MQENELIDGVFQYIKKNKFIPAFINSIKPNDPQIQKLMDAIEAGNEQADIFSTQHCHLYLLYLIKNKKIPFWQGITVYFYVMTLMQFTNKQKLNFNDNDVKFLHDMKIDKLIEKNALTKEGNQYLQAVIMKLEELHVRVSLSEITDFIKSLPKTEQWLFKISYRLNLHIISSLANQNDQHQLTAALLYGTPPQLVKCNNNGLSFFSYYWSPSASVMNFITSKLSPHPIIRQPILGSIGKETLTKMHEADIHPYPLYSPHVKSNLKMADGYRCGPVLNAIHDDCHTLWGNMLSQTERNILFKRYIPQLKMIASTATMFEDKQLNKLLNTIIDTAADLDLVSLELFSNPTTRFSEYIINRFWIRINKEVDDLSLTNKARMIHLIREMILSSTSNKLDTAIWKNILLKILRNFDSVWGHHQELEKIISNLPKVTYNLNKLPTFQHPFRVSKIRHLNAINSLNELEIITDKHALKVFQCTYEETAIGDRFFMIGAPIQVKKAFLGDPLFWCFRDSINDDEIQQSFPTKGFVKLFKFRHEAEAFAQISDKGDKYNDKHYAIPAVFEVRLQSLPAEKIVTVANINKKIKNEHQTTSYLTRASFLTVNANQTMPLNAEINIPIFNGSKIYPRIDLKPLASIIPGVDFVMRLFSSYNIPLTPTHPLGTLKP